MVVIYKILCFLVTHKYSKKHFFANIEQTFDFTEYSYPQGFYVIFMLEIIQFIVIICTLEII